MSELENQAPKTGSVGFLLYLSHIWLSLYRIFRKVINADRQKLLGFHLV